jgi:molybdopterin molybdotransferase
MEAIDVREAWRRIEAAVQPLGDESVPLHMGAGRVLRQDYAADRDLPPFDRAAMDGFAVRSADLAAARRDAPCSCRVVGESTPGAPFGGVLAQGHVVRIMTGAPVPPGADAVLRVEDSSGFASDRVELYARIEPGANIAPRASERRAGDIVFTAGARLRPVDLGGLAMLGAAALRVGRRARVAVLSTGNELVPHETVPGPAQIRNSNGPMLEVLATACGASVTRLGVARDTPVELQAPIAHGLEHDILLMTGGVSMGAYDFVTQALAAAGVRFLFQRVLLQPGQPTVCGVHRRGLVFALPGNPVSAFTTFRLFAALALRRLEGDTGPTAEFQSARARFAWQRRHSKWLVLPGRQSPAGVERVEYGGSGDLSAYARANCQIVLAPEVDHLEPGDAVAVWPLDS